MNCRHNFMYQHVYYCHLSLLPLSLSPSLSLLPPPLSLPSSLSLSLSLSLPPSFPLFRVLETLDRDLPMPFYSSSSLLKSDATSFASSFAVVAQRIVAPSTIEASPRCSMGRCSLGTVTTARPNYLMTTKLRTPFLGTTRSTHMVYC